MYHFSHISDVCFSALMGSRSLQWLHQYFSSFSRASFLSNRIIGALQEGCRAVCSPRPLSWGCCPRLPSWAGVESPIPPALAALSSEPQDDATYRRHDIPGQVVGGDGDGMARQSPQGSTLGREEQGVNTPSFSFGPPVSCQPPGDPSCCSLLGHREVWT